MSEYSQSEIAAIADEIIRYLDTHPKAADTLEGITKWWVARQRYYESAEKVQKALEFLVVRELITRVERNTGDIIYTNKYSNSRKVM